MKDRQSDAGSNDFEQQARVAAGRKAGVVGEFWYFLTRTRKWWMAPIILALLAVSGLIVLGTTAAAPLIYALF